MKRSIWVPRQAVGHCAERPGIDAVAGARSETHPHRGRGACAGAFMRIWRAQGGGYGVSCPVGRIWGRCLAPHVGQPPFRSGGIRRSLVDRWKLPSFVPGIRPWR